LGKYVINNLKSQYTYQHGNPKEQICRYNYDKIDFKYDKNMLNPITNEIIDKPSHNNWGFEYFNRDKDKKQRSNDKPQVYNNDYNKVYNPITDRFFN
jgi:hypothetical protein